MFLFFAIVFIVLLAYASYDIGSRTTFPGSRPQLMERLKEKKPDTLRADSTSIRY
jgi:hypothetical protein